MTDLVIAAGHDRTGAKTAIFADVTPTNNVNAVNSRQFAVVVTLRASKSH
jgi:hypothetical protein